MSRSMSTIDWAREDEVFEGTEYATILKENRPRLERILNVKLMMASMISKGVVTEEMRQIIEAESVRFEKASKLLDFINEGTLKRFYQFILAIKESGQAAILNIFKFNPDNPTPNSSHVTENEVSLNGCECNKGTESSGKEIRRALTDNLVYLKGETGLEISDSVMDHIKAKHLFPDGTRGELQRCKDTHARLTTIMDILPRRPDDEIVAFAKILNKTDQGHHLRHVGITLEDNS